MSPSDRPDQEPEAPGALDVSLVPKGRQALSRVRRELSEEEFASPAAQRLLIDDMERLERERNELLEFREKYFVTHEKLAVLQERAKRSLAGEIVFGACLALAGALMGFAPTVWNQPPSGWVALLVGGVLLVIGIVARVVQK
jgi:hypothetical protein